MDSSINASSAVPLQAFLLRPGTPPAELQALLRLAGQELDLILLAQGPEGARLRLPGGAEIQAQGELPYPEGTALRVRVQTSGPGASPGLRLQTLEARPPLPPALLHPLLQGEAESLLARLSGVSAAGADGLPAALAKSLAPLLDLLTHLNSPEPAPTALAIPAPALPSLDLARLLASLPPERLATLAQLLDLPGNASLERLASELRQALQRSAQRTGGSSSEALEGLATQWAAREAVTPDQRERLQRALAALLERHGSASTAAKENLLPEGGTAERSQTLRAYPDRNRLSLPHSPDSNLTLPSPFRPAPQGPLNAPPFVDLESSAPWETWLRGTTLALTDPTLSPREAPLHALQSREGTALFELPLPWPGASPLQLWVEKDSPGQGPPETESERRVLLALRMSRLGDLRVGLQVGPARLTVRIWAEHTEPLEARRADLEAELRSLHPTAELRILPLGEGPHPTPRTLALAQGLEAMG